MPRLFSDFSLLRRRKSLLIGALTALVFLSAGSLYWLRGTAVLLTVDGKTRKVYAKGGTVSDLLFQEHIPMGPRDFTSPILPTYIKSTHPIKVTRVTERLDTLQTHSRPVIEWSHRTRQNLRRVLVQKGRWRERVQTIKVTLYDGTERDREIISDSTKPKAFFTLTLFNADGFPLKKYDLIHAPQFHMLATGYYVGDPMVPGDITKLGYKLQRGLVAIDPKVIPLGSRLYIPGYGYAFAADTGSAIKGQRIDLAVKDVNEERLYNHRHVTIYVLDQDRKW